MAREEIRAKIARDPEFQRRVKAGEKVETLLQYVNAHLVTEPISVTPIKQARFLVKSGVDVPETPEPEADPLDTELLGYLSKHKNVRHSVEDLSDRFDTCPRRVRECVERLRSRNYLTGEDAGQIYLSNAPKAGGKSQIDVSNFFGGTIRFGAMGDTHLCSKYAREDILNALYDIYEREGVTTIYHTGNWIDGEARFNRNDIFVHGMGNQVDYFVRQYPQRPGLDTYFIAGDDHEGWYTQQSGVDIGQLAEDAARRSGRTDLHYLGYMEHDIVLQSNGDGSPSSTLRVTHPGGGSAYALSYTTQKLIESFSGGEKPAVMLIGHYHKAEYLDYRNVHAVQTGTVCDQTPFMRKKRLSAHIGGWIVELNQAQDGSINRCRVEWIKAFDRDFYTRHWSYQMKDSDRCGT